MEFSLAHLLVLLVVVFVLFGAGRLPKVMSDLGKGIRSFKEGLAEEEKKENDARLLPPAAPPPSVAPPPMTTAAKPAPARPEVS